MSPLTSLAVYAVLALAGHAAAATNKSGKLRVTGVGRSDIGTTLTQLTMGIQRSSTCDITLPPDQCSALEIQDKINAVTRPLISYLSGLEGVKSVQADGLNIEQQNERRPISIDNTDCAPCIDTSDNDREVSRENVYRTVLTGYTAESTIVAVVPSSAIGEIIDQSLQFGVNDVYDVSFFVDANTLNEAKYKAIASATTNAVNQASAALGVYDEMILYTNLAEIPFDRDYGFDEVPYTEGPALIGDDAVLQTVVDGKLIGGIRTIEYKVKLDLVTSSF
ncbi:hypothetical protein SARC_11687 [Sphaeroforma arctica JP610]|uniref:Uncharacterized protein n=1 Tax=Sphaeroforma arctica JP610 TaxID=667725 RepID=A0A0L0FG94_9EUKA|nr:hypothetical protein SARC_11687 [Sphaeroforma arctica JP610]KNC75794.1 hypothetical protein SARC_11687 [Sphaeroforma arctica JP610]|eukprot:XP_014149696.1 hypothetical protein SARC_11687 [Sphaeroforma arctica JP610]